jgi:hypothetical protein
MAQLVEDKWLKPDFALPLGVHLGLKGDRERVPPKYRINNGKAL